MLSYYLFTFESSNKAMAAKTATKNIEDMRIIPLIPEISAGCGLALKYSGRELEEVVKVLKSKNVEFEEIYSVGEDRVIERVRDDLFR